MSTTTTIAFAGSEMETATATHLSHASPAKSRKSFGISRKASAIRLAASHHHNHEKQSSSTLAPDSNMPLTSKEKKSGSSGFLSYFFRPFRSQKSTPSKKIPHTTALEQSEFAASSSSSSRKDSKFEPDFSIPKVPSLPSTPLVSRFSQALFIPPSESSAPSSQHSVSRSSSDSPCLFAAFEQAIKSGVLTAPAVPPELIVKSQQENETRGDRRSRFVRKGSLSRSLDITWTQKLFILTPGLLIQYGSDGPYDREPERILRLRPESLVYVTDILDGKPFVLQITTGGIEGLPLTPDERRPSLISRAAPKARFDAHIIFLVFENADEMQEWMIKVRKEISRLGGPSIEEHPHSSSKAGTIVEEEDPRTRTPRRSLDSFRKGSISGRKSDEIATSASTAMSQDGLLLDGLRTSNNSVLSQRRGSQISLNTSSERSVPDIHDKRYSMISTSHSYSSTDLRSKSRPVSTTLGTEHTASERPPSPTLTQMSTSSFGGRRSRGHLPAPIPIPVPSIPKRYSTAGSSISNLPSPIDMAHRRVRRNRKSSAPPSPDKMMQLLSTSLPNPKSPPPPALLNKKEARPRPVSLASAPVTQRRDKSQNYNRRSVGSLSSSASVHGPPLHPPPSVPLPKLPDGSLGNLPKMPFTLLSPYQQGVPPVPQIPIPIPHSPLALHSQSAADIYPVGRKQSIASLSRA
ncbi:hypothetical protein H072_687 [Dactylellina haptotyla CBS 200.50]|uniref:PH domain-containing protein n=1 Tax=Dactylellina haptotyla (strain CBS 200.50) TaxID=1284197 RepID=S8C0N0_DACHA|nr:hypothetical protein H072_687 [Dactylellina haptotyla CBS 200.50]